MLTHSTQRGTLAEFAYSLTSSTQVLATAVEIAAVSLYGLALTTLGTADPWGIYATGIPVGDLDMTPEGELLFTSGIEQARQEVQCRFGFFLGEYFLDTRQGLPYYRDVFVKSPNRETVLSLFTRTALSVPGIIQVSELTYDLDSRTRKLAVTGEALWIDGQPVPLDMSSIL